MSASAGNYDYKAHVAALRAEGSKETASGWTRDEALAMAAYLDEKTGLTMARSEPSDADYARAEAMADPTHPTHPMHDEQREAEADAFKEPPTPDHGFQPRDERTLLAVPFAQKDEAKLAGARWDATARAWFVPVGAELAPFEAWLPGKAQSVDPVAQFADALRRAGLQVERPEMDGQLHRVPVEGDRGRDRSGAYKGHLDGHPAGFIQNFKTGEKVNWKASGLLQPASGQDREQMAAAAAQKLRERTEERELMYERTAGLATALWDAAAPVSAHPYLEAKGVEAHGLRQGVPGQTITVEDRDGKPREASVAGHLLVPVREVNGKLSSLQVIRQDGNKMFMPDGRVDGGHSVISDVRQPGPLLIAEGFSTAATVHELTGHTAIVAFNAGNLSKVAQAYREQFPDRTIYIAGDNDHRREAEGKPNVGREKAEEAATAIGSQALIPAFSAGANGSDWNDLARIEGREAAQLSLLVAIRIAERERMVADMGAARLSDRSADRAREPAELER